MKNGVINHLVNIFAKQKVNVVEFRIGNSSYTAQIAKVTRQPLHVLK